MVDINKEIFRKISGEKKLAIVKSLTNNEVLSTTTDTLIKIVKEIGVNDHNSRTNKKLYISRSRRMGNDWNSTIDSLYLYKGKLLLDVYVQFDHTDTTYCEGFNEFFRGNEYFNAIEGEYDEYGRCGTCRIRYSMGDRVEVMRSFLLEYVYYKYIEKAERERAELAKSLMADTTPITNKFYKDKNVSRRREFLDKYSSPMDFTIVEGYSHSFDVLKSYVNAHVEDLKGMSKDDALEVYNKVFNDAYNEFSKTFDAVAYKREHYWF